MACTFSYVKNKTPGDEFHRYSNTGLKPWSNQFKEKNVRTKSGNE